MGKFDRDVNPDFIEVYEDVLSKEFCDILIKEIDRHEEFGVTCTRKDCEKGSDIEKSDTFMFLNFPPPVKMVQALIDKFGEDYDNFLLKNQLCQYAPSYDKKIHEQLWSAGYQYFLNKYSILNDHPRQGSFEIKIQKTRPTEGYHIWHCENDGFDEGTKRVLAWMIYLNDDFEAGETEFLYQSKRIQPKTGRLVIWPAGFTHTHRGNPPIGGTKYAVTGWIVYE